jgi:hypothetical protein
MAAPRGVAAPGHRPAKPPLEPRGVGHPV